MNNRSNISRLSNGLSHHEANSNGEKLTSNTKIVLSLILICLVQAQDLESTATNIFQSILSIAQILSGIGLIFAFLKLSFGNDEGKEKIKNAMIGTGCIFAITSILSWVQNLG